MDLQNLRVRLEPLIRQVFHFYSRFARGMTLGVRAIVLDHDNCVFLVKHSYVSGWHLPGGGVETGETFMESLTRELREEGRIELTGEPALHGLFFNRRISKRDHVAVYVVRAFTQDARPSQTARLSQPGFLPWPICRRTRRAGHGRGSPKFCKTRRSRKIGYRTGLRLIASPGVNRFNNATYCDAVAMDRGAFKC